MTGADMRCTCCVHAWGQDRLEVEQQLSLMALELLTDIIPSAAGSSIFGMRLVPHVMANFVSLPAQMRRQRS
jgi:hypothetical protein